MPRRGNPYRDASGKFASKNTGSLGSLRARTSLKKSRAKLAGGQTSPQQRGAVTRGSRALARAKAASRRSLAIARPSATIVKTPSKRRQAAPTAPITSTAASAIRRTGRLSRTATARSAIKPFSSPRAYTGKRRRQAVKAKEIQQKAFDNRILRAGSAARQARESIADLGKKKRLSAKDKASLSRAQKTLSTASRALRTYSKPKSKIVKYKTKGVGASIGKIDRLIQSTDKLLKSIKEKTDQSKRKLARMNARTIAQRNQPGITGKISRAELAITGTKEGMDVIRRRAERASRAAERGSKAAARAREIYGSQMLALGPGKPSRGSNTVKPGPRSTKGQEPPKRKKRSRKPKK